ncbi:MAG: hypothetical protein WA510_14235 [Acidobacteriaceae bacterium]
MTNGKGGKNMNNGGAVQPLSAGRYALIAFLGLLFAIAFTVFYVHMVPSLVQTETEGRLFYLLLIPWGLSAAVFLFGAMRAYARFTYKHLGVVLELGGPVVLFCGVVYGGFKLVPQPSPTFDLAVRAHSAETPLITSGQVTLELPGLPHAGISSDGEANFKSLPEKYKATPIRVLPDVDGYEKKWVTPEVAGSVLNVTLEKEHPVIDLTGTVMPLPRAGKKITILVDGQKGEASPDQFGRFKLTVNGKAGDTVRVMVYQDGKLSYYDDEQLPGPITLKLHKPR